MSTKLKSIKVDFTSFFVKIRVIRGLFLFLFLNAFPWVSYFIMPIFDGISPFV
jgi:hypothetical protein